MTAGVTARETTVEGLFAQGEAFCMPPYQRSYSWGEKEARDLLNDLTDAASTGESHFIGAIVLVRTSPGGPLEIVDGQQRLTTITILLCVLRDLEADPKRAEALQALICDAPRPMLGEDACWRLTLNHMDGPFFRATIQERGAAAEHVDEAGESDSQSRMSRNAALYLKEIGEMSPEARAQLARTVLKKCELVRVHVQDRSAGYKVFRVLNTRGKEPNTHDILKTELFERGGLTVEEAEAFSHDWSEYEARLGDGAFDDLLRQIRFIHDRSRGDILSGFRKSIIGRGDVRTFLRDELPAYVKAYREISKGEVAFGDQSQRVNDSLNRLRTLEHHVWRAPALKYLVHRRDDRSDAIEFFQNLERLGFVVQLILHDREQRNRRYRKVIDAVESDRMLYARNGPFALSRDEHKKVAERLRGRFATFGQRRALALRLNAALEGGETLPPEADATVEHVLPRNPDTDSHWNTVWPNPLVRRELCDTIGNLVLLPHSVNQRADRMTYLDKQKVYFDENKKARYALTQDILDEHLWTPDSVRRRTERLADILCEEWGIRIRHKR
ncbi:MAG: DUF262 domain-containing HNH endonuclease family protein [Pseudomonadota bacterium]